MKRHLKNRFFVCQTRQGLIQARPASDGIRCGASGRALLEDVLFRLCRRGILNRITWLAAPARLSVSYIKRSSNRAV